MNLISCENCGVVLDKNRLIFPIVDEPPDPELVAWNGNAYVPIVPCPVCESPILKNEN